ncbi:DUF2147 domain-containing protein [Maritalea porphyrae]|uniref:DUF2147 domain-containing protein n=1 Tax=Maritalea porphyrae TaxID=880732 RepID=A0ABQ5USJ2_9HYPH|nr:DUF2147 domain-containing protein [Maritalea porphyrae]GLQ18163.1 hypothetical protein GCM10007879_24120 [Maritalea porphyrae]
MPQQMGHLANVEIWPSLNADTDQEKALFGEKLYRNSIAITMLLLAILTSPAALANDPTGTWLTKDKAEITIERCGDDFYGIVSKPAKSGLRDIRNPDPALGGRPILGMPLLRVSADIIQCKLPGELHNPFDGKM